jgi:hypothetical protein
MKRAALTIIFKIITKNPIYSSPKEKNILSDSYHFFVELAVSPQRILKAHIRNNLFFFKVSTFDFI